MNLVERILQNKPNKILINRNATYGILTSNTDYMISVFGYELESYLENNRHLNPIILCVAYEDHIFRYNKSLIKMQEETYEFS